MLLWGARIHAGFPSGWTVAQACVIPANEYVRTRWKNGQGWTREILRVPDRDDWDWRLSIAEIEQDAAFSSFPGIDRELVLLRGNGVRLVFEDGEQIELEPPHGRIRFAGERGVHGTLRDGATHDFNLMARGLAEREDLRSAFGTYVDKEAVRLILSGELPREGFEVEASILFCDIRGFTTYAEQANASEVIATLNQVFTAIVPVVESFGGHVDKFLGDGLLAMFGTPEPYPDHADRAVAAAQMLVDVVAQGPTGLRMAAGVNTGRLVVGPLGGGGRFNFSVIGDAVNVAARVEAATRQTGDDVLLTADTLAQCHDPSAFVSRGKIELKGKSTPVEVFAPASVSGASE